MVGHAGAQALPLGHAVGEAHGPTCAAFFANATHPPTHPSIHWDAPAGEKLVLGANGRGALATCALRPSGIFGEYDTLLVPTTVRAITACSVLAICLVGVYACERDAALLRAA